MAANEWSERQRMIVTLAVGVLINAALGGWFYYAWTTFNNLDKTYKTKFKQRGDLKASVDTEGPLLKAELEFKTKEFKEKQSKLPNANEVRDLMISMSKLAADAGVSLKSSTYLPENTQGGGPGTNYERNIYSTRWSGSLYSWCKFINGMEENFKRFISFEKLTITPKGGLGLTGTQHDITVDVVAYRYVPKT